MTNLVSTEVLQIVIESHLALYIFRPRIIESFLYSIVIF